MRVNEFCNILSSRFDHCQKNGYPASQFTLSTTEMGQLLAGLSNLRAAANPPEIREGPMEQTFREIGAAMDKQADEIKTLKRANDAIYHQTAKPIRNLMNDVDELDTEVDNIKAAIRQTRWGRKHL